MGTPESVEITRLLRSWRDGSEEAGDQLWRLVYRDLRQMARSILRGRRKGVDRQPTSLVHQAYLRLLGAEIEWTDRRHFFAVAAKAMRFVLADEARRQLSLKRGAGDEQPPGEALAVVADPLAHRPDEVLAVHEALERLALVCPRHERLVELRYFAGFSVAETAKVLEVTPRTVARDWMAVKVWLYGELGGASAGP